MSPDDGQGDLEGATRVTLVRHGRTAWNAAMRIQGHVDIELDEVGRWQAQRVADALADEPFDALYTSDLKRTRETAMPLAQRVGRPMVEDVGLRERHFGGFEGLTYPELDARDDEDVRRWRARDPDFAPPPGGESMRQFQQRAVDAVTRLARRHGGAHVVVVSHGGVLDALYRAGSRIDVAAPRSWHIGNASIHRMLLGREGWTVVGWNDEFHLEEAQG